MTSPSSVSRIPVMVDDEQGMGAPSGTGSCPTGHAPTGHDASRFDPSRWPDTIDLRPWGWAPGAYVFRCIDCPSDLDMYDRMGRLGDKRSWRCEEHALAARDSDGSGEAGVTGTDTTEGNSAGAKHIAHPSSEQSS